MPHSSFGKGTSVALDSERGQPFSQPLKTLEEVLSWKACGDVPLYTQNTAAFVRPSSPRTKPYTLVCHDFKGGYLEDRYLQGGAKKDAFYFCRWECIDIFVYFSHHFVTVPPLGWVRAAHKHGNMILGTVITEWDDGASLWRTVLSSRDTMSQLVDSLVNICRHHGFDGWLVNIENKIEESHVEELRSFVALLTTECHKHLPGSKVLWYDSVTRTGELKWQDQLNEENSQYFDACDGIFLNYCWTPEKLASSREVALQKGRPFDVFVGIDVFGRGCPGGGGFNTREALEQARKFQLSAAVFAPGWVLETLGAPDFDHNDCRFWAKLHDLCQISGGNSLPLSSAFCQGHGDAFFCMGQDMTGRPWYNMSLQQRQPERCQVYGFEDPAHLPCQPSLNTCLASAYLGGCSVELSAHLTRPLQTVTFRLFSVRAKLDQTLYCSYTYRDNNPLAPCHVYLVLTFGSGLLTRRAIMGEHAAAGHRLEFDSPDEPAAKKSRVDSGDMYVSALRGEELDAVKESLWFHDLHCGEERDGEDQGWKTRHFKVDSNKLAVSSHSSSGVAEEPVSIAVCLTAPPDGQFTRGGQGEAQSDSDLHTDIHRASILLGHLQVFREQDLKLEAPKVKGLQLIRLEPDDFRPTLGDDTNSKDSEKNTTNGGTAPSMTVEPSFLLEWDIEGTTSVDYFNVYLTGREGSPSLVGHTATMTFVTNFLVKFVSDDRVTVTVQPVLSATGLPLPLSRCVGETLVLPEESAAL